MIPTLDLWPDSTEWSYCPRAKAHTEYDGLRELEARFNAHRHAYCLRSVLLGMTDTTDFSGVGNLDDINETIETYANPDDTPAGEVFADQLKVHVAIPDVLPGLSWNYWEEHAFHLLADGPMDTFDYHTISTRITAWKCWLMTALKVEQMAWDLRLTTRPAQLSKRRGRPKK